MFREQLEIAIHKTAGHLQVDRTGSCSGYKWQVKFVTVGGNKPTMEIVNSTLNGLDVRSVVSTIQDGGMLFGPLTGEFLQTAEKTPQVFI